MNFTNPFPTLDDLIDDDIDESDEGLTRADIYCLAVELCIDAMDCGLDRDDLIQIIKDSWPEHG